MLKIHILYRFNNGPWGGGNQFLKALYNEFNILGCYSNSIEEADVLLFNANPKSIDDYMKTLNKYQNKTIIFRFDGPIFKARGNGFFYDKMLFKLSNYYSDGNIFQSNFSRDSCKSLGLINNKNETVILNAPDKKIFNTKEKKSLKNNNIKIKIITTSWSSNERKGFDILNFLDENLNFDKFEYTFVGNSPIIFENIKIIPPVDSNELSKILQGNDIFISTSKFEACSNSLIEAIHCGCFPIARNNSSHPEIVSGLGLVFDGNIDIISIIEKSTSLLTSQNKNSLDTIDKVAELYLRFAKIANSNKSNYKTNKFSYLKCAINYNLTKIINKFRYENN